MRQAVVGISTATEWWGAVLADGEVSTPATPFATIHVDHKGPLPRQADSKFAHI